MQRILSTQLAAHPHETVAADALRSDHRCCETLPSQRLHRVAPQARDVKCHGDVMPGSVSM